jgi:type III pantothenate kinase
VAGQDLQQTVQNCVQTLWDAHTRAIATEPQAFGVRNGYKIPAQLGVDRWMAVLAAYNMMPKQNICVVQCGSAITIDTVTAGGHHKGGLIIPGTQMMKNALFQQTHSVKIGQSDSDVSPFTDSTNAAVNHGVLLAAIGFVDRAVSGIETELRGKVANIISGGDAPMIIEHSHHTFMHEPELVLKGLALYADKNT